MKNAMALRRLMIRIVANQDGSPDRLEFKPAAGRSAGRTPAVLLTSQSFKRDCESGRSPRGWREYLRFWKYWRYAGRGRPALRFV